MMSNEKFKNEFIDRTTIYIGDFYTAERICTEIDSFVGLLLPIVYPEDID